MFANRAHADPRLPAATRAKLELLALLHGASIYVPSAGTIPPRLRLLVAARYRGA